jgi:hypothetical protein
VNPGGAMKKIDLTLLKQCGIGLLELMLSLSIIAILLIMATRYYLVTSYSQRLTQISEEISQIQGAAYSWKGSKSSYDGLDNSALIDSGLVTDKSIVTPWGSAITVKGSASGVKVTFTATAGGETKACTALADKFNNLNGDERITAKCDSNNFEFNFY